MNKSLRVAGASIVAGAVLSTGCSAERAPEVEARPTSPVQEQSPESVDEKAVTMWKDGLDLARETITAGKPVRLIQLQEACMVWDNQTESGKTIVKNPVLFSIDDKDEGLTFVLFFNEDGTVMNGPYSYQQYAQNGDPVPGTDRSLLGYVQIYTANPTDNLLTTYLPDQTYSVAPGQDGGSLMTPDGEVVSTTVSLMSDDQFDARLTELCPGATLFGQQEPEFS